MVPRLTGEHRVIAEPGRAALRQSGNMMRLAAVVLLATTATALAAPPGETPPRDPASQPATPLPGACVPVVAPPAQARCESAPRPPERAVARSILLEVVVGGALGIGGMYGGGYLGYKLDCAKGCPGEFGGL